MPTSGSASNRRRVLTLGSASNRRRVPTPGSTSNRRPASVGPAGIRAVLAEPAEGAGERDRTGEHPYALIRKLADAGFGGVAVQPGGTGRATVRQPADGIVAA